MTPTLDPTTLLAIKHHDVRDALDALYEPLPVEPDQWTRTACGDLQRRLYAALAQVEQLAIVVGHVSACRESAVRGVTTTSGGMDRWNDFCNAVTELEIHAVPYSVPNCRNKDWIRDLLNTLNVTWVAFAQAEPCHRAPDDTSDTRTPHHAAADAAAAVLASPSLRERLGRAPLGAEGVLP